ncbi:MAG: cohesin domain-containing protein [Chloroflexota bacterium]|nr:cohesin domain-containing protein [Chloroflexota bacterium]
MLAVVSRLRPALALGGVLVVLALLAGTLMFNGGTVRGAAPAPTLALEAPATARVGQPVTVQLRASGVRNLAGFQSTVAFDAAHVRLDQATITQELKGTGRDLLPLGPVLRPAAVVVGAVTCPVSACASPRYKAKNPALPGVQGRALLAELVFTPTAAGRTELRLDGVQLVDPQGAVLPVTTSNAAIDVIAK